MCFILSCYLREIRDEIAQEIQKLKNTLPGGFVPHLAIVQVGGREDSNVYIRMKIKAANEIGIEADHIKLPRTITQHEVSTFLHKITFKTSYLVNLVGLKATTIKSHTISMCTIEKGSFSFVWCYIYFLNVKYKGSVLITSF